MVYHLLFRLPMKEYALHHICDNLWSSQEEESRVSLKPSKPEDLYLRSLETYIP